eukprot:CAMPEP_0114582688 /NCGR_PEP_ID=MMETSP0125-20121206/6608_1 /TAXON_ID=485358 ORGANISM="Aristerostoma sp., Strain ATCC 50986" /NCGR_SAMPLE_ID=MMETSP0125 /ASSEMBLY_ACC=CAM_ASM_000245 /LENGTH=164 /DNA_ID=CAMNT_0001775769 /DNA_START=261 /DNA_END=754 /DNA_ORIENTATION=-
MELYLASDPEFLLTLEISDTGLDTIADLGRTSRGGINTSNGAPSSGNESVEVLNVITIRDLLSGCDIKGFGPGLIEDLDVPFLGSTLGVLQDGIDLVIHTSDDLGRDSLDLVNRPSFSFELAIRFQLADGLGHHLSKGFIGFKSFDRLGDPATRLSSDKGDASE